MHLLTPAQMEVLRWVAEAKSNAAIALILELREGTVRTHVQSILKRLAVENRTAAALHYLTSIGRLRNFV